MRRLWADGLGSQATLALAPAAELSEPSGGGRSLRGAPSAVPDGCDVDREILGVVPRAAEERRVERDASARPVGEAGG